MSVDLRVGKKYRLGRKFNGGSFGDLYLGVNVQTGEEVAIKLEPVRSPYPQLMREAKVYKAMEKSAGIPRVRWCGAAQDYNALVLDLLGKSLEEHFENCDRRLSLKTVLTLADQLLERLECLHAKGFIHRDVKPDNFLMGRGGSWAVVHMIDFGLSKLYCHPTNKRHIPFCEGKKLTGTVRYASINAHLGYELSRRDDLESLAYCFLYFLKGKLPWQGLKAANRKKKYEYILDKKTNTPPEVLCRGLPVEFCKFLVYTRGLKFDETPDYAYLRQMFRDLFFRTGFRPDNQFDWEVRPEQRSRQQQGQGQGQQVVQRSTSRAAQAALKRAETMGTTSNSNGGRAAAGRKKSEEVKLPNIFYGLRNRGVK
eukprot:CAMPEP_0114472208 /NCGR_PEP_ID=MMETSP0104-20121206/12253_1 /TAXON_ID=37642 ORGANISM="Paraphysomonas imperforata, Strain PA2" /NCGR_SAMPLE_ID=MMETSP0104 /ASSEMBLY_ACC=CAM_ASM_000202 /LENGTH=367 /DNA_ID=CAMNT_0001646165 /DNA_START=145 /DNA_END=1248 /DNA_ORIENTATION=-